MAVHLADLIRVIFNVSQSVMSVVKSSARKFCLFLVVPEGEDHRNLVNSHLIIGENPKNQNGACLIVEILEKDGL